jgi:hypothetical protein
MMHILPLLCEQSTFPFYYFLLELFIYATDKSLYFNTLFNTFYECCNMYTKKMGVSLYIKYSSVEIRKSTQ